MFIKNKFRILSAVLAITFFCSFKINDPKDDINNVRNDDITKEEVYDHIKYLSSDALEGRFPGTAGDSLTENYIAEEFKNYGLLPAGNNGYLQSMDMVTNVELKGINDFQITSNGNTVPYIVEKDFMPLSYSSRGKAVGELVFIGYGISAPEQNYDDYKDKNGNDIDIKGKILVMMRYSPGENDPHNNPFEKYEPSRYKTLNARDGEAAGIIFITGPQSGEDKLLQLKYDNILQNAGLPVINCNREIIENIFNQNGLSLDQIQKEIDSTKTPNSFLINNASAVFETDVEPVNASTDNVIGFLEGNDPVLKNEVIVVGAHKDHLGYGTYGSLYRGNDKQIHNGADDNASGTAGVMELAQKLSANKKDLKRSVLFICFAAEEAGLLGSAYFAKSELFSKYNIVAMLNMDMIGRLSDNKLIIYGTGTSSVWDNLIDSLNKSFNFNITKTPDGFGPSDHSSFYAKNVPVLHFFTGTHTDYHSPSDDIEKINTEGEVKVLNFVYDVAVNLDEMKNKPDFIKVVSKDTGNKSMGNVKVYVGTIPDYSSTAEGMKLAGVKEGSPAEKGGLMAEDIIIKFGNKDVKNIYDYMYAMGEFKPGEEAEVIVLRKNEKVSLKLVLGSR
ncbi:MAG TPA: M20/M25/M40 family metallo-hydrolase [Ignavibacteria bacterium]|nr:M20/M25/M40 family metallo-hydrolase [Ignavibacteria bacterium]